MHRQMIDGSIPSRESRRKAKNRKRKPQSGQTLGFRALYAFDPNALNPLGGRGMRVKVGESAPVRVKRGPHFGG
jgi:hypothetical protein